MSYCLPVYSLLKDFLKFWVQTFHSIAEWDILCFPKKISKGQIGHFTVKDGSEAGGDLASTQTFLLYYVNQVVLLR